MPGMCWAVLSDRFDIFKLSVDRVPGYVPGYFLTDLDVQTICRQCAPVCAGLSSDRFI